MIVVYMDPLGTLGFRSLGFRTSFPKAPCAHIASIHWPESSPFSGPKHILVGYSCPRS